MNDRELLELAAKAAGLKHVDYTGIDYDGRLGVVLVDDIGRQCGEFFPLADDGDALRLAVCLKMSIDHTEYAVHVAPFGDDQDYIVHEPIAASIPRDRATRRAIVRAAAEIGKAMQ